MIRRNALLHGAWYLDELPMTQRPYQESIVCYYCPTCGWWTVTQTICVHSRNQVWHIYYGLTGALRHIDHIDASEPISEIRKRLLADFDSRFVMDPRKMEEVVSSVFNGLGYRTELTTRSDDGGIDVIITSPSGKVIGVEVKRYRSSIEVEQIRSFVGALVLKGLTSGVFVTTSKFRSGARSLATNVQGRGINLQYVDGQKLFELLKVSQVQSFARFPDFLKDTKPRLRFADAVHLNSL